LASGAAVSRTSSGAAHNTVNRRRIKIFFQRFPGTSARSGIADLDFTVRIGAAPAVAGRTPADGKVEILLGPGETATLEILGSQYQVSLMVGQLHPIAELRGVQQRLNMLGYAAGPLESGTPPVQAATSLNQNKATEHAIIDFQSDHEPLLIDAIAGPRSQQNVRQFVANAGGE
jgi:hypothetical protein